MNNYFDSIADDFYSKYFLKKSFLERKSVFINEYRSILHDLGKENINCLDLGCGPGVISIELARNDCEVTGVDQSSEMIDIANRVKAENSHSKENKCLFVCDDIYDFICKQSEKYNVVVMSSVFEYLKTPEILIEKLNFIIKNNGFVLVSIPNRQSLFRLIEPLVQIFIKSEIKYIKQWGNKYSSVVFEKLFYKYGFILKNKVYLGMPNIFYKIIRNTNRYYLGTMELLVFKKVN